MNSLPLLIFLVITVFSISDIYGNDRDDKPAPIDGASVLKMGRTYKNPLLRLIGTAMRNNKKDILSKFCSLYRCSEWSDWSACSADSIKSFGMAKRTRHCGKGPTFCPDYGSKQVTLELDSRVCMGENCPTGYTKTENGYCFLLAPSTMQRDAADNFCESKGGYVVNINSEEKHGDFKNFRIQNGRNSGCLWIDGRRANVTTPWIYKYEQEILGFNNWGPGQPDDGSSELFLCISASTDGFHDAVDAGRYVVCEYA